MSYAAAYIDPYSVTPHCAPDGYYICWEPCPDDFQTSQTMDAGSWGWIAVSRFGAVAASEPPCYNSLHEFAFASADVPDGNTVRIYGPTWITPQLAAQTVGSSIDLRVWGAWKKRSADVNVSVRGAACIYRWAADDTLGDIYLDRGVTGTLSTSYANKKIERTEAGGITLGAGDRLCADIWLEVTNNTGSGISGAHGDVAWGTVARPSRLQFTVELTRLQGMLSPSRMWGGF